MAALASEQRVWRELTQFHFTKQQIDQMIQNKFANNNFIDSHRNRNNSTNSMTGSEPNEANTSNKSIDIKSNCVNSSDNKTTKRFGNTKDWQKIYHALRR